MEMIIVNILHYKKCINKKKITFFKKQLNQYKIIKY